jgi:acyl-homoserine-lactone acylase
MYASAATAAGGERARWQQHARDVTIVRDNWGIAHIYGRSDADAVFGTLYAQAEDDFNRIERNYLNGLGWLAQAEGESAIFSDLRARLFIDPVRLQQLYRVSPEWLQALMTAWSDGLNYYLFKHPAVHPKVIRHFEPWMALSFTEGSIGGDIETIDLVKLREFYDPAGTQAAHLVEAARPPTPLAALTQSTRPIEEPPPGGSNGFAIAPSLSASGHALLWINPHTSYYFRSELQMVSEQGLNVYGAVTWGQFFVYQGWNAHNGWMHTSYGGDAIDEYAETIVKKPDGLYYEYGGSSRKLQVTRVRVDFRQTNGAAAHRDFTVYHSHHGPIIRAGTSNSGTTKSGTKWIAIKLLQDPVPALAQSYLRTKTANYQGFLDTQEMRTDTSNNTVYADADGTIAYFHGNFIPKRDPRRQRPGDGVAGSASSQGHHHVAESQQRLDPEHQQLAVLGRGRGQSEARRLSGVHVDPGRESARYSCRRGAAKHSRGDPGQPDRGGLRQPSHRLRCAPAAAVRGL